jgi:hypothetical protein
VKQGPDLRKRARRGGKYETNKKKMLLYRAFIAFNLQML